MGQYQQWLSAQEVHQRLKVEKETLETELLYLRDRITILEQSVPEVENVILQALQAHSQAQSVEGSSSDAQAQDEQSGLARVELPLAQGAEGAPAFPTLYSQMERGADMLAFFDKRGQTDPHLAAWRASEGGQTEHEGHLVDEETRRLNESIQRWFVRWHRQLTGVERSEEARRD